MSYSNTQEILVSSAPAAASFSTSYDTQNFDLGAVQVVYSALDASDGSVDLLASVDGVNFETLLTAVTTLTTAAGNHIYNITTVGFNNIKVDYEEGSNTSGTVSVFYARKSRR